MGSFGQGCLGYVREGAIWFYEGVKDFVGEDGMVIIQVVAEPSGPLTSLKGR